MTICNGVSLVICPKCKLYTEVSYCKGYCQQCGKSVVPYPEHCIDPKSCVGFGSCPRAYSCVE